MLRRTVRSFPKLIMSSPYSTPDHQGPGDYSALAAASVRPLQIITAALVAGVVMVTGVMLVLNGGELKQEPELISWIGIGMAVVMTINHFVIPGVVAGAALKKISGDQIRSVGTDEKFALLSPIFSQRHIIAVAILEGAAFLNLVFYMVTSFVGNLAAACILLMLILIRFPTPSRVDFWVQDRIRELEAT